MARSCARVPAGTRRGKGSTRLPPPQAQNAAPTQAQRAAGYSSASYKLGVMSLDDGRRLKVELVARVAVSAHVDAVGGMRCGLPAIGSASASCSVPDDRSSLSEFPVLSSTQTARWSKISYVDGVAGVFFPVIHQSERHSLASNSHLVKYCNHASDFRCCR